MVIRLFVLIALALTSCSEKQLSQNEIVKKNVEEDVKEKLNNPSSYEFVKLKLIDSVTYSDNIEYRKNFFIINFQYDRSSL